MNRQAPVDRLAAVEARLDQISAQLEVLVAAQRPFAELTREMGPIAADMMSTGIEQMAFLEERGYFAFIKELKYLVDRLVEDYDPGDLHELADNAANILDTVKSATQPPVMAAIRDALDAFNGSKPEPVGLLGAWKRVRGDKNIQRGLGFALDVIGRLGRAVSRSPRLSRSELRALPGSDSVATPRLVERKPRDSKPAPKLPAPARAASVAEDRFIPDAEWNREAASAIAAELGMAALSDDQWALVETVRSAYTTGGSTPNIRKLTAISGASTRDIYTLFPKAPGLTLAQIAGVPKPVGCL